MKSPAVTWLEVNNMKLVLGIVVSALVSYGVLFTKVSVLENKVDNAIALNREILDKYSSLESRYGQLSTRIVTLEVKLQK